MAKVDHDAFVAALTTRFEQLDDFINRDLLGLRGSVAALVQRVAETGGLTASEQENEHISSAVEWAVAHGMDHVAEHIAVSMCAAFEVFVEDIFVSVCINHTPEPDGLPKLSVPLARFITLSDEERWRFVWNNSQTQHRLPAVDRYDALLRSVGLDVRLAAIESAGTTDGRTMDDGVARDILRECQQVRNVILHRGGIADQRLARMAPTRYRAAERLRIDPDALLDYGLATFAYAAALGAAVIEYTSPTGSASEGPTG